MTRAMEELHLISATSRLLYGSVQHNPPSRFLSEIDAEIDAFDPSLDMEPTIDYTTEEMINLREGDRVKHPTFGIGEVRNIDEDTAEVKFKNKGIKKLNINFAPLEKL